MNFGKLFMHDDTQQLKEVTVTAQKPLVKVEVDKLTYSLEDDPEAKTSNALEMFRKVPMVTVDGEDKIQLKGSSNYKIYMNGKPSNLLSGDNASDVLKSMPASSIKNIEVITDPGSKYDAEGVGGIINIITTKNALQGYTGTIRANASTLGSFGGGGYVSMKAGKFGITANYGYNYRNSPWNDTYSMRDEEEAKYQQGDETFTRPSSLLNEHGRSKNKGPFQYGYLEGSYEIDTLNLLSVGVNLFRGKSTNLSELIADKVNRTDLTNGEPTTMYSYKRYSDSKGTFGSTDVNVDFQHSTSKKDELLTLSYRFSQSPNDNEGHSRLEDLEGVYSQAYRYPNWNINDASTTEHTAQVDYTTPLFKDQTLEAGVKYINRQSKSNTLEQVKDSLNVWQDISQRNSDFRHTQHIYSAYLGYMVKFNKFGAKAGVRAEGTSLNAEFAKAPEENFKTNYFDVVPNATLTYQLDMSSQLRLGYNMRIQRPRSRCERRRRGAQAVRCARSTAQRLCTRKTLGGIERHRHADHIRQRDGNAMCIALLAHGTPRFGISPRQAKEQQRAERINIATHARLPKTVLLGRRIGTRAKLNGIGIGTVTPDTRDPQINNHQRGKGHAGIGRIVRARHDDIRGLQIAMDHRRRLPRRRKAGMELAHRIAQDGI